MKPSFCFPILEASQVGEARRTVAVLLEEAGLSETLRGQAAIVVTELGTNLIKHTGGKGGSLVVRSLEGDEGIGVEILSLDQGPGMSDVLRCMTDGYSTAGSAGTGLGAVKRLSSVFDIYSQSQVGCAILSRLLSEFPVRCSPGEERSFELGAICLPIQGEKVSGDALELNVRPESSAVLVADGLGHGPMAAAAALEATRSFRENSELSCGDSVRAIHGALRSTRGAAIAVARVDLKASLVRYSGLGNISGSILSPRGDHRRLVSHNGTAGVQIRRVQEFEYRWEPGSALIMHSDGLSASWGMDRYPGLLTRHPALIAGVLYRDFNRGRDDASVIVLLARRAGASWKGAA